MRKSDGRVLTTVGPRGKGAKRSLLERDKLGLKVGDPRTAQHIDGNRYDNRRSNLTIMSRSANVRDENVRGLNRQNKARASKRNTRAK